MVSDIPFGVLTGGLSVILFGFLTLIYLHFLRRKMRVLYSFVLSLGLAFLPFFLFNRFYWGSWFEPFQRVQSKLLQTSGSVWVVLIVVFLTPLLIASAPMVSERLSRRDFRSFYHLIYGVIIVSLLWLNHSLAYYAISVTILLFITGEYLRRFEDGNILTSTVRESMNGTLKGEEKRGLTSTLFYILGAMIVVVFLNTQIALASILVLAIGDTSISRIGEKLGQHRFVYNPNRTVEGLFIMVLICFITLQLVGIGIITSIFASFSAALFESLDVKVSDNLLLPLITGMIILAV